MQSVRRAVLRSAASAAARASVASAQPAVASLTAPIVRRSAASAAGKTNLAALAASRAARYFSYTVRVANAEEPESKEAAAAETTTTTSSDTGVASKTAPVSASADAPTTEMPFGVYVSNMVFDASEQHLEEAFKHYGSVQRVSVARDSRGLSRGYGFVWFSSQEEVDKAIKDANGSFWHGRRIVVQKRTPRPARYAVGGSNGDGPLGTPREPTDSLYIGNLPYETTDADLNTLFAGLEGMKAVRVAVDRSTGWPRGFAHADFDTVEHATAAREALVDRVIGSRTIRTDYAVPTTQRQRARGRGNRYQDAHNDSPLR